MADGDKYEGKLMLLKMGDGGSEEAFASIAGIETKSLVINDTVFESATPDAVTPSNVVWSDLKNGVKSVKLSGDGTFVEGADADALVALKMSASPFKNFQVVVPGLGTFEGNFHVEPLEFSGDDMTTFTIGMASNGAVTFT